MSNARDIALASTLALGPPRSWVEGCAAWVDSRDEQCGKPRAEGYLCARHRTVAERHLEKKKHATEKRKRQRQERLDKHGDRWHAQLARVEAELERRTGMATTDRATFGGVGAKQLRTAEEVIRLREEIDRLKWYCLDSVQVAEAEVRLADGEREKARQEGRAEAYYSTYLQITQGQHKENQMNIVEPRVELIAHTTLACDGRSPAIEEHMSLDPDARDMQQLVEFAGRACYQSFAKPNPATAKNEDYIARTLHEQKHWSIAEHATATFYITGVSRALTHELIRHRHLSYSQLSQRFVDESEANIVIPPAARGSEELMWEFENAAIGARHSYRELVDALLDSGLSRKQAREAARAVLPNMIETRIVVTGNMRAWHEVIERRTAPDADAEFQEVAGMIREELQRLAPEVFPEP